MPSATIVFSDIVGFSELNNEAQVAAVHSLSADVSHELYAYYAMPGRSPAVVTLPTGDGMAVALLDIEDRSAWSATLFGLLNRLSSWSQRHQRLRVGVHYGAVAVIRDINGNANLVGAAINMCQRIMDSAHPGQCLFSEDAQSHYVGRGNTRYADDSTPEDQPYEFKGPYQLIVKHGVSVPAYAMSQRGTDTWNTLEPSIRGEIQGKIGRTRFIIKQLQEIRRRNSQPVTIYEQSLYSSLGIADDGALRPPNDRDGVYERLKIEQRDCFFALAREERTTVKLVLNTRTNLSDPIKKERLKSLLTYLDMPELRKKDNLHIVELRYQGPNRLIVGDSFMIDGYRLDHTTGYPISMVAYDRSRIEAGINEVEETVAKAEKQGQTTRQVVENIRNLLGVLEKASD